MSHKPTDCHRKSFLPTAITISNDSEETQIMTAAENLQIAFGDYPSIFKPNKSHYYFTVT